MISVSLSVLAYIVGTVVGWVALFVIGMLLQFGAPERRASRRAAIFATAVVCCVWLLLTGVVKFTL